MERIRHGFGFLSKIFLLVILTFKFQLDALVISDQVASFLNVVKQEQ